ncbi:hypothetical protein GCM10023189_04120 [Nibrella saemangeumensis]|uniref:Uncharacterized protein n=1 Tax=Nibrella saemangeumensis TaxID=1084526 RepID=A0ABP8MD06_9BACT
MHRSSQGHKRRGINEINPPVVQAVTQKGDKPGLASRKFDIGQQRLTWLGLAVLRKALTGA